LVAVDEGRPEARLPARDGGPAGQAVSGGDDSGMGSGTVLSAGRVNTTVADQVFRESSCGRPRRA
jgi:hypothetical protein